MKKKLKTLSDALSNIEPEKKSKWKGKLKRFLFWSFITGLAGALVVFGFFLYFYLNWQTDKTRVLKQAEIYYNQILRETRVFTRYKTVGSKKYQLKNVDEPIRILDYRGEVLGVFSNERRNFISFKDVSPHFLYALFSTEDSEFFHHSGVNYKAIMRAMIKNIMAFRMVEGGSTLTQQLSKLLFTDRQRNIKRKIYEFFCARELEKIYTKKDILLMYVNLIFLGHGAYGVEYASQLFFKKPAKNLSIGEAALLVAVISNPYRYSPFLFRRRSMIKHKAVLNRMVTIGYISKASANKIFKSFWKKNDFLKKDLARGKQTIRVNHAPYVVEEVRRFIVKKYGAKFFLKNKGASIYTTIDKRLQVYGAKVMKNHLKYLRKKASNKLKKKEKERIQGAVLFSVPATGEIRVLVGGDGFSSKNQLNRAYQARRQIGSTIKPFLYLSGIEKEVITPYKVFEDKPVTIEIENAPEDQRYWEVKNYGDKYKGYLTATEALYRSSNVVAAQVAYLIGLDSLKDILRKVLGISVKEADKRFPSRQYSLALGATEMTPLEVNTMFITLANQGQVVQPFLISKIQDNKSRIMYEAPLVQKQRVVSGEATYLVLNMMRGVFSSRGTAGWVKSHFGLNDMDGAGKTGTTQDSRDTWFNGITQNMVGTVWVGQDDNLAMGKKFTGGGAAAPIWGMIMKKASTLYNLGKFELKQSYKLIKQPVCLLSGMVPEEGKCKFIEKNALFIEGTEPGEYCKLSVEEEKKRMLMKGLTEPKEEEKTEEQESNKKEDKPIGGDVTNPTTNTNSN